MLQEWQQAGLAQVNPSQSPVLKEAIAAQLLPIAHQYLNGNFTLWDIAGQLDLSVIRMVQSLQPLAKDGILEFQTIPDLSLPTTLPRTITSPADQATGLPLSLVELPAPDCNAV